MVAPGRVELPTFGLGNRWCGTIAQTRINTDDLNGIEQMVSATYGSETVCCGNGIRLSDDFFCSVFDLR
jgi:hypothetical protein